MSKKRKMDNTELKWIRCDKCGRFIPHTKLLVDLYMTIAYRVIWQCAHCKSIGFIWAEPKVAEELRQKIKAKWGFDPARELYHGKVQDSVGEDK